MDIAAVLKNNNGNIVKNRTHYYDAKINLNFLDG